MSAACVSSGAVSWNTFTEAPFRETQRVSQKPFTVARDWQDYSCQRKFTQFPIAKQFETVLLLSHVKLLLILALFLLHGYRARAQLATKKVDSLGSDYVVSFLRNYEHRNDGIVQLHMTLPTKSKEGLLVTVEYPGGTFYSSTTLFPGNVTIVNLPRSASLGWSPNTIQKNSVRVFSSDLKEDFVMYMVNYEQFKSDAALALPTDALNTKYVVVDYTSATDNARPEFVVTAAYDDTIVTITPTADVASNPANVPFNMTLRRGESFYAVSAIGRNSFTGTQIDATRPVTATNGVRCANVPVAVDFCDHIFEVAQPVQTWGKRFAAAPLPKRSGGSLYRMVAAEDNTTGNIFQ